MIRRFSIAAIALLIAIPLSAQSTDGLRMRVDQSTNANDPDDVPEVTLAAAANGFQVNTGPAVVVWEAENTATGVYDLSATFTLQEPSSHNNYYGLVYGAGDLDGEGQNYMYFLIGQNGSYIVSHRANDETVHSVQGRTAHDAVVTPGGDGTSVNELAVRVGADETEFVINGTVVFTAPQSGMTSRTDGIYGIRVNHVIPGELVENLTLSR